MGAGSVDVLRSFQCVPGEFSLPAATTGHVTTVTWVTALAPATQVMWAWPVSCAVMGSMELPVKVGGDGGVRPVAVVRDADGACCQPVTVQNTGHVMADSEVQGRVSVMAAGWGNAVKLYKVSGSELRLPHLGLVLVTTSAPVRSRSSVFPGLLPKRRLSGEQHLCVSPAL